MNEQTLKSDKRLHPRVEKAFPVKIAVNGYDFTTNTENISRTGTYCRINKYIPPFTKVSIKLILKGMGPKKEHAVSVECKGVVVRSDDSPDGSFNIAIFFNDIKESECKKLAQYLSHLLENASMASPN